MDPTAASEPAARRQEAIAWLVGRINYERNATLPYRGRGLKLDRMHQLLLRLGEPQRQLDIVHVAGTKGKGSTSATIAAVLTAAGKRTGLFTSPHLDCVGQRLAIDGAACPDEDFVGLCEELRPVVFAMDGEHAQSVNASGPTYFEITTAMALLHFARRKVDAVVLEVGLGGRLDSTNVCMPRATVITNVSFDHTQQLGHTLSSIAWEKAGIIKPGVPVVSGAADQVPRDVIRRVAEERGCRLVELERDFDFQYRPPRALDHGPATAAVDFRYHLPGEQHTYDNLMLSCVGSHQAANAAVALATLAELRRAGWALPESAVRHGLANTRLPARIEVVGREPTVIIDAAHNVASVEALVRVLHESFSERRRTLIFGTTRDKDARGMLAALAPHFEKILLSRYEGNPRSFPPQELVPLVPENCRANCLVLDSPRAAWEHAGQHTAPAELIAVTGSFYLAAEMRRLAGERPLAAARDLLIESV